MMLPEERTPGVAVDPVMIANLDALQEPGEPDFLGDLIGTYLQEAPIRLAAIGDAIGSRDMLKLARACHLLKGSSSNMGAERLSGHCKDLEIKAAMDQYLAIPVAWAKLTDEFANVKRELEIILAGRSSRNV